MVYRDRVALILEFRRFNDLKIGNTFDNLAFGLGVIIKSAVFWLCAHLP
jgi:hypothetical protein